MATPLALRDYFDENPDIFASVDFEALPAGWCDDIVGTLTTYFPAWFPTEQSAKYFRAQKYRLQPFIQADAIRRIGQRRLNIHPRRFAAVWESQQLKY